MSAADRTLLATGYAVSALGIVTAVCGIAMFWGPLRQVLGAPAIIAIGIGTYVLGRWYVYEVRRGRH
ncbi:hypothetical protein ACVHNB_32765 [Streptomyces sp. YJ-C3]